VQKVQDVTYQKAWRYTLGKPYSLNFGVKYGKTLHMGEAQAAASTSFYTLSSDELKAGSGYAWDGASGPVFQTKNSVEATLVHDIMYQAMAADLVPATRPNRKIADKIFLLILKKNGMGFLRRRLWYAAVRLFGANQSRGENRE